MARKTFLLLLSTLLISLSLSFTVPAQATTLPQATGVRIVYGDRMLTTTWQKVPGATKYRIQYATMKTFKHAKTTAYTSDTTQTIKNLVNKKRYYLRVLTTGAASSGTGKIYTAIPQAGYPSVMPAVKVKAGAAANQIIVSWSKLQRATRVIVLAGSDNQQTGAYFHSAWLPATATSTTLTIPDKDRWLIGSGTGNAIYVKVGQYNNLTSTQIRKTRSDAAFYRLSLANSYGFAATLPVTGSTALNVATYNVQSVAASPIDHAWAIRMPRVVNNIVAADPDLIGLQEDDAAQSMNWQHRQVASALTPHGYAMSGDLPADYKYNLDVTDAWFYYKTSALTRLDGGIISPRNDLNINWPAGMTDTRGTWAKFQIKATGQTFYAVDIHLPASGLSNTAMIDLRTREAAALSAYIQRLAVNNPIVLLGDLNAAVFRDGYSAPSKLHDLGWYDTASTINRTNADLQTANAPISYPTGKPERALNVNKGRIDYIFTKNMGGARRYVNQNILKADGTVNLTYQGSDHNLQMATLIF